MKKHNFNPGPAVLPEEVIQEAANAVIDFQGKGLSILEISHRSSGFISVLEEAEALVRELLTIDDSFGVVFLTGGASSQFFMVPMNLLDQNETAAYVDTGTWSSKAIKEAKQFGKVEVIASSKEAGFTYIPKGFETPGYAKYLHLTSNNTIYGSQFHEWPETEIPIVCDMSSDIFSRPLGTPIERFGLIFAGAQKNMGAAGTTLAIIRKDMLGKVSRTIPSMLDYRIQIEEKSSFNTPPVFPIYVSMLTLKWIKENGGLKAMEQKNLEKSRRLYIEVDRNKCFRGVVRPEDRSTMNVTFVMADGYTHLEDEFAKLCKEGNCEGVKGHRSVGGFRASIYNALTLEDINALVEIMQSFEKKHG